MLTNGNHQREKFQSEEISGIAAIREKYPQEEKKYHSKKLEEEEESGMASSSEITVNSIFVGRNHKKPPKEASPHPNKIST